MLTAKLLCSLTRRELPGSVKAWEQLFLNTSRIAYIFTPQRQACVAAMTPFCNSSSPFHQFDEELKAKFDYFDKDKNGHLDRSAD
eukprot:761550-Hanusia_phi.AAC.2